MFKQHLKITVISSLHVNMKTFVWRAFSKKKVASRVRKSLKLPQ